MLHLNEITIPTPKLHPLFTDTRDNGRMPPAVPRFDRLNDRRARDRYTLSMSLRYRTAGEWISARTLDMSANGMLLEVPEDLRPGTRLEILMDWPGVYFGKKKVRLFLIGSVTRVEPRGAALRIVRHQFRDVAPRPAARTGTALPARAVTSGVSRSAPMGA